MRLYLAPKGSIYDAAIDPVVHYVRRRIDGSARPLIQARRLGRIIQTYGRALDEADIAAPRRHLDRRTLADAFEAQLADLFKSEAEIDGLSKQLVRFIDRKLYREEIPHSSLLTWMNFPLLVRSPDFATAWEREFKGDELYEDYPAFLYASAGQLRLSQLHAFFAGGLCLSLISDRILVVETDFAHRRNMVLKYLIRPFESRPVRRVPARPEDDLFLSRDLVGKLSKQRAYGFTHSLKSLFSGELGSFNFDADREFGPSPDAGFYYMAYQSAGYEFCYIFPLYREVLKQSPKFGQLRAYFDLLSECLFREGQHRLESNQARSVGRHTIAVQTRLLDESLSSVLNQRARILSTFDGDRDALNTDLSRSFEALRTIQSDVQVHFENEFNTYGDRNAVAASPNLKPERVSPENFKALLEREFESAPAGSGKSPHLKIEMSGAGPIEIADTERLARGIREFFTNAKKYSPFSEAVIAKVRASPAETILSITNLGPALSAAEIDRIPSMGFRGLSSQRHTPHGTGQGLASAFSVLEDLGMEPEYSPSASRSQKKSGNKQKGGLSDLATHTVTVKLKPRNP